MWEKIVKIEEIGHSNAIDIEVSGNHLFYANDILTHNSNSDLELGDVSESIALASTCDFMLGVTQSEQLAELGQYSCKQLKNRYGDKNYIKRFFIGVDKPKMRLYDIDQDEAGPIEDKPVMDTTEFGEQDYNRKKPKSKFGAGRFELFK